MPQGLCQLSAPWALNCYATTSWHLALPLSYSQPCATEHRVKNHQAYTEWLERRGWPSCISLSLVSGGTDSYSRRVDRLSCAVVIWAVLLSSPVWAEMMLFLSVNPKSWLFGHLLVCKLHLLLLSKGNINDPLSRFIARNSDDIDREFTFWNKHLGVHVENLVMKARKTSVNLR